MLNTLKRKIALVAVSAVGMSGLALMSAPAANALTTAITAVSTVPQRAAATANTVSVIVTSSSDTTQANNIVVGDTVNIVGRVLTAPTPAAADSLSSMTAGDSLSAINVFLPSGAASGAITLIGQLASNSTQSAPYTNAFATAGTYTILIWADAVATGPAALTAASGNNTIDGGEAAYTATITIGGSPTSFALSKTADTTAGASAASLGITLKDASSNPTLLNGTGESITVVATMSSLQTDTLTVTKFQPTRSETFTVSRSADFNASNHSFWTADGNFVAAGTDNVAVGRAVAAVTAGDSFTALTGSYNLTARHGGANVSTLSFNFGGSLTPVVAQTYTLTTSAVGGVTKAQFTNGSGLTTAAALRTAPVVIETATALSTVFASTTGAATIGWKLTGTAAAIVNVVISGSTVAGVTSGTYPTTIGADGTATYTLAATAPVAGQSYTISVNTVTANNALTTISHTIQYATPAVTAAALGSNGISTDLLTATVNSAIVKVGAKTEIKVTVVDQFGTPGQFYAVTGTLSAASRNTGATIATAVTDATGVATISLTDVSTSTTNLSDAITVQVSLAGVGAALLTGATNVLTLTYSATGAYASLAIAGGTTALATVTREIESVTSATAGSRSVDSEVTLTPTLTNSSGVTVTGVGITYTGSDGVYFRSAANTGVRPAAGDLKTITAATGTTVRAFATKPGTATITATGGGLTATATFTVSNAVAATARNITAVAAAGRVTASIKDGWGNPVAGVVVNFAADSKGIFGNGVTSTSATTDATGQAAALVQSADGTGGDVAIIASLAVAAQSAAAALAPVADFATAGNASVTVTAKPTAGSAGTDTAIAAVKADVAASSAAVATANAAVKALATQVTVLQASVATLIDSLTTQIASLLKSVSALTKAVAKLQKKK